jgi:hypothetical protein
MKESPFALVFNMWHMSRKILNTEKRLMSLVSALHILLMLDV